MISPPLPLPRRSSASIILLFKMNIMNIILIVLLLLLDSHFTALQTVEAKKRLVQVQVLYRHGARYFVEDMNNIPDTGIPVTNAGLAQMEYLGVYFLILDLFAFNVSLYIFIYKFYLYLYIYLYIYIYIYISICLFLYVCMYKYI